MFACFLWIVTMTPMQHPQLPAHKLHAGLMNAIDPVSRRGFRTSLKRHVVRAIDWPTINEFSFDLKWHFRRRRPHIVGGTSYTAHSVGRPPGSEWRYREVTTHWPTMRDVRQIAGFVGRICCILQYIIMVYSHNSSEAIHHSSKTTVRVHTRFCQR